MTRVLILGLDGVGPDFARRAFAAGRMPFLAAAAARGTFGAASSTVPPVSTAAWTTISTGVGIGRHGIVDFRRRESANYAFVAPGRLVSSRDVGWPRLWDLAARAGLTSFVLNLPVTFPATTMKGAMVTGVLTPPGSDRGYWPPSFAPHLRDYKYDLDEPIPADVPTLCARLAELEELRAATAAAAFGRDRYDLAVVVFTGPDRLFHRFYREAYTGAEPPAAVVSYLRRLDAACERAAAAFGDAALIVTADHGFGPGPDRTFHVNRTLRRAGWLSAGIGPCALNVLVGGLRRLIGQGGALGVEWRRTRAYGFPLYERWGGVVLNVRGEQPEGIIPPARAADAAREVAALLAREEVVSWARPREELYDGPAVRSLPHVVFECREGCAVSEAKGPGAAVTPFANPLKAGDHSMTAMAMVAGPGVPATLPAGARIADVAATVAAWLGLPREGMEGKSWVGL